MPTEETPDALIGTIFDDRYQIESVIGSGAMGTVFGATHKALSKKVALKILHPWLSGDTRSYQRFLQEARAISMLNHPNVVKIDTCGRSGDHVFIAMEFIDGEPLSDRIKAQGKLSPEQTCDIISQAAKGLAHAHSQGILHRDVKPSNFMLCKSVEGPEIVQVVDFGIAKITAPESGTPAQSLTSTNASVGTPYYMSPEQCANTQIDQRSDIYSLGCVIYECLSGTPPFEGDTPFAVMFCHLNGDLKPLPESVPSWLQSLTLKCMAQDPAQRFQSMDEVAEAIASQIVSQRQHRKPLNKRRKKTLSALPLLVLALGTAAFIIWQANSQWQEQRVRHDRLAREYEVDELERDLRRQHFEDKKVAAEKYLAAGRMRRNLLNNLETSMEALPGALRNLQEDYQSALNFYISIKDYMTVGKLYGELADVSRLRLKDRIAAIDLAIASVGPQGSDELTNSNYAKAFPLLEEVQELGKKIPPEAPRKVLATYWLYTEPLVRGYIACGRTDDAYRLCQHWLETLKERKQDSGAYYARALFSLGSVLEAQNKPAEARKEFVKALDTADQVTDSDSVRYVGGQLYLEAAQKWVDIDPDKARGWIQRALKLFHQNPMVPSQSMSHCVLVLAQANVYKGQFDQAQKNYQRAKRLIIATGPKNFPYLSMFTHLLARDYAKVGKLEDAIKLAHEGQKQADLGTPSPAADFWHVANGISEGDLLYRVKRVDEALAVVLKVKPRAHDKAQVSAICTSEGIGLNMRRDYRGALNCFQQALLLDKERQATVEICGDYIRIFDMYASLGETAKATEAIGEAAKYVKIPEHRAEVARRGGKVYIPAVSPPSIGMTAPVT